YRVIEDPESGTVEVVSDAQGISPKWGTPGEPPGDVPSYSKPTGETANSTAKQAAGMSVFARACAVCHGEQGRGDAMAHAINDPVFLALSSDQVLRRYVITGRSDLGMPGYADARPGDPEFQPLTENEVASLVALLASWRRADIQ